MDFAERYRAISARDRRFDGQFIFAVRTTGIYCRPSCPARTPKYSNVEFFLTSASAQLSGYRACRRCLPEAVPGSPEWNLRDGVTARVMRLIADGVVEREGVTGLANRVGYSTRQLNRVLNHELGAGPLALARAQRAHNARQLIVSTTMPISEVSFASGFQSIRQFNDTVSTIFGMSPSELRLKARTSDRCGRTSPGTARITLAYREPMSIQGLFDHLLLNSLSGIEANTSLGYARAIYLEKGIASLNIREMSGRLEAHVQVEHLSELSTVFSRIRRMCDLDSDPVAVDAVLASHRHLSQTVLARPGIRLVGVMDSHEAIVRAVLGRGLSTPSALAQVQKLIDELGETLPDAFRRPDSPTPDSQGRPHQDSPTHHRGINTQGCAVVATLFPRPDAVAKNVRRLLRGSQERAKVLERVCEALAEGTLVLDLAEPREQVRERLRSLDGVQSSVADYLAMRVFGDPDVLLASDPAVLAGARKIGLARNSVELSRVASSLSPWRSYLSTHLQDQAA